MSNDRDLIFSRIKAALPDQSQRSAYPEWSDALPISRSIDLSVSMQDQFARRLESTGGLYFESVEELIRYLASQDHAFGYCDPGLADLFSGTDSIAFETEFDMEKVDDYRFGITKASAGIAESGTLMLKDAETSARLGALAPWVHVAVLRKSDIVPCLLQAIERFGNDPSVIFCTGPSKTADVEGILIKGVHGPGVQIALVIS